MCLRRGFDTSRRVLDACLTASDFVMRNHGMRCGPKLFARRKVPSTCAFIVPVSAMECSENAHLSIGLEEQALMHR
jgi:hypothetical protein